MTVRIDASPTDTLLPDEVAIRASGFAAGERVRIGSRLIDDEGVEWIAHGCFVADADGVIDVATAPSEEGTFTGIDAAGLLWSMRPSHNADRSFMIEAIAKAHKLGQPSVDPLVPLNIVLEASTDGVLRAQTTLVLRRLAEGIDVVPVRDGRLRGIAFRWRDRSVTRGAIMSLTGSGGGVEMGFAPVLASLGYDVLSLAYFAYEDLPEMLGSIPLEYFEEGFQWMQADFGCKRIAVQGASRGGELTVVLAAYLPEYVKGAIPIVPMYAASSGWNHLTGETGPSWTFRGNDIPYAESAYDVSTDEMRVQGEAEPNGFALTPWYRATMDNQRSRTECAIPIENAAGPLLLISGLDDQMWPCSWGSDMIIDRLRARGFTHSYRHLALPETGHWTPLPNTITTFTPAVYHSVAHVFLACGGTPAGTARWSRATWNAMRRHYEQVFGT